MKDYYKILGVSRQASPEEIKKSYRRLAFQYHPDRNSDPSAAILIKDLNEAYDVLGDDTKRLKYNYRFDNKDIFYKTTYSSTTRQSPPQKKYYGKKIPKLDFTKWAFKARFFSFFILLFCGLLSLDYFISSSYENVIINNVKSVLHSRKKSGDNYVISKIESNQINFTICTGYGGIDQGDTLNLSITPFFGIVKECSVLKNSECVPFEVINIYSPIYLFVLAAMGTCFVALYTHSKEQSLTFSIASCFIFTLVFYFFIRY